MKKANRRFTFGLILCITGCIALAGGVIKLKETGSLSTYEWVLFACCLYSAYNGIVLINKTI